MKIEKVLGLDVGEKRIGVALGDSEVKIAAPLGVILNGEDVILEIEKLVGQKNVDKIVVGLPRNAGGVETQQSAYVRDFSERLLPLNLPIIFQDESLTSVEAENTLYKLQRSKNYNNIAKGEIDARAAALILQDFLEAEYAKK
ncbi:MAG: Holliday junction resolvase RuvX [Candidatus Nomurabacteria bacterium]|jgi:putative Holliday junction resolvase|nr:Holliday junction resolvase RuvX [Candidatus Nomurabacteria bacterium]